MSDKPRDFQSISPAACVRPFCPADTDEWKRLRHILWPETTEADHVADLAEYLSSPRTHLILVAEAAEGRLAGIAEIRIRSHADGCYTSPVGYLEGWIVDLPYRRNGIGRAIVDAAEAWSRSCGCREFASDAYVENSISRAAHRSLGFQETSAVVRYWKKLDDRPSGSG